MADPPEPGSRRARRLEEARRAAQAAGPGGEPVPYPPTAAPPRSAHSPYGAGPPSRPGNGTSAYAAYTVPPPETAPPPGPPRSPGPVPPGARPGGPRVDPRVDPRVGPRGGPGFDERFGPGLDEGFDPGGDPVELRGVRRLLHLVWLPALGVLLLAWSLTTLVGDVRWGPFSVVPVVLACLSPLTVIAAVPVVLVAVQRRRWASMVPAAAAAILPWSFVIGYALPADTPPGATVPLRAMIVTARDGQADAADIAQAVRSQRADLLVVTELSSMLAHELARAGLPDGLLARYVQVPDAGASAAAGIGVYSRFPVDDKHITPLAGTHWPAAVVPVQVGPTTVTLVAGHAVPPTADHLDRWRRDLAAFRSAERIKGPVLVLVNLDATPWNPQYRQVVSGRLHDAADVLGKGLRPTWPAWAPVPLLATDHVLVAGLAVGELSALPVEGSDHRALSVALRVPQAAKP